MFPKDILSEVHKTDVSCPACGTNVGHTTFAPRFPCRTSDLEGAHMRRSTKPTFPKRFENPCRERLSVQTRHNLSYRTTCGPTECSVYTRARRKKMQLAIPVFPCPAVYFTSKKNQKSSKPTFLRSLRKERLCSHRISPFPLCGRIFHEYHHQKSTKPTFLPVPSGKPTRTTAFGTFRKVPNERKCISRSP